VKSRKVSSVILYLAFAIAASLASISAGAQTEESRSVEEIVTRLKHELVQAYLKQDVEALERRTRTKADEIESVRAGETTLTSGRYDVVKVRVFGDVAVMSGHGTLAWEGPDGLVQSQYYSFNVFAKRDGEWKYVAAFTP
jgi:hypothetical protein